jgi:hypothetical protein
MVRRVLRRARSVQCALVLLMLMGSWSHAVAFDPVLDSLRDRLAQTVSRFVSRSFKGALVLHHDGSDVSTPFRTKNLVGF